MAIKPTVDINENYKDLDNLTPFKRCVLQNFPFIEADFDAVTNYQLLCKVVEYLNNVIDNSNKQNDNISQVEENFKNLYDWIDNWFDNLNVQDEIDEKLDKMVIDGTLEKILDKIIKNPPYISAETIGCDITGNIDCSELISEYSKRYIIFFPKGNYRISKILTIYNPIFGEENSIINLDNNCYINCLNVSGTISSLTINHNYRCFDVNTSNFIKLENITINQSKPSDKNNANFNVNLIDSSFVSINSLKINGYKADEYYQNDGIHINGGCHNIYINDCYIQSSDDVIAINAAEGNDTAISDVYINDCTFNSIFGVRFYGKGEIQKIKNVFINNITMNQWSNIAPAFRFLNGSDYYIGDFKSDKCFVENININNIISTGAQTFMSTAMTTGSIYLKNINAECNVFLGVYNSLNLNLKITNAIIENSYLLAINPIPLEEHKGFNMNVNIYFEHIKYNYLNDYAIISTLAQYNDSNFSGNNIDIVNSNINVKALLNWTNSNVQFDCPINIYDSIVNASDTTLIISNHDRDIRLYNIIANCVLYNNISSKSSIYCDNIKNTYPSDVGSRFFILYGTLTCYNSFAPLLGSDGSNIIIKNESGQIIKKLTKKDNSWLDLEINEMQTLPLNLKSFIVCGDSITVSLSSTGTNVTSWGKTLGDLINAESTILAESGFTVGDFNSKYYEMAISNNSECGIVFLGINDVNKTTDINTFGTEYSKLINGLLINHKYVFLVKIPACLQSGNREKYNNMIQAIKDAFTNVFILDLDEYYYYINNMVNNGHLTSVGYGQLASFIGFLISNKFRTESFFKNNID